MAAVRPTGDRQGLWLGVLRAAQIGSGLAGQVLLLTRWSPHEQTDLFLVLSGVPWLVSAALLIGGVEMAFPAVYHQMLATGDERATARLTGQVAALLALIGAGAALLSGTIVAIWAIRAGLAPGMELWWGLALGGQALPAALGGLWRGLLTARARLIEVQLALLAGSLVTVVGYALLPPPPALALPLATLLATLTSTALAWHWAHGFVWPPSLPAWRSWREQLEHWIAGRRFAAPGAADSPLGRLGRALVALSAAAALVQAQTLVERLAVQPLGPGKVAAFAFAGRGWEAVQAVLAAALVTPAFPRWAAQAAHRERAAAHWLLRQTLARMAAASLSAGVSVAVAAWLIAPWLESALGWATGAQAARLAVALAPRFVLLGAIQPLVLKQYAQGTPWPPVLGAALGVGVLSIGALWLVPRWGVTGLALTTALSVLPGWGYLLWREGRDHGRQTTDHGYG